MHVLLCRKYVIYGSGTASVENMDGSAFFWVARTSIHVNTKFINIKQNPANYSPFKQNFKKK
jgi:hypothetical protein